MNTLHTLRGRGLVALLGLVGLLLASTAASARPDADRPLAGPTSDAVANRTPGCQTGSNSAFLDVNNVRASLYNTGGLFWKGGDPVYEIPKGSGIVSIFASGIWLAGQVNGQLRSASATYAQGHNYEYWPGPLDAQGSTTAATCQTFDRYWKVNKTDIQTYNSTGGSTVAPDLVAWPVQYGAPYYVDANGNGRRDPAEVSIVRRIGDPGYGAGGAGINLAANERPDIVGDQGVWWVMNDVGNQHTFSLTPAIGVEVRVLAFAFATADALNNTTFYKYQISYRGAQALTNAYLGLWSDPDLGEYNDDYVGSDADLGIGFVYNGDAFDDGATGYGRFPPALGYDYFQGPLVDDDGIDNDGDGEVDEEGERIGMEKFVYYNNNSSTVNGNPNNGEGAYNYLRGIWLDGSAITLGGDGTTGTTPVDLMFPADPPAFWSEYNVDGAGTANTPADRRFIMSSGPFTIQPNDEQEIVFGIVWSQATCTEIQPQITSVRQMKFDDRDAQGAFNANFVLPPAPPSVVVDATPLDRAVVLEWTSVTGSNADIFNYEVQSPFADPGAGDQTYNFEGFKIFQYRDRSDTNPLLIATYDLSNGVTTVVDEALDCENGVVVTGVVAQGTDNSGTITTPTSITITQDAIRGGPLRNNTSYFFGVQAYAYNAASDGKRIFAAALQPPVEVRPGLSGARNDGTVIRAEAGTTLTPTAGDANGGQGTIRARIVNPGAITGDTYQVVFFRQNDANGALVGTNYNIVNVTTGEVVFDGRAYYATNGTVAPQTTDVTRVDGLTFDIQGPDPGFQLFTVTANAAGPLVPPQPGAAHFNSALFPTPDDASPTAGVQQSTNSNRWLFFTGGQYASYDEWIDRTTRGGANFPYIAPFDFEMRFTGSSIALKAFQAPGTETITVPFEIWNTGVATPNNTADDYRMIPLIFDEDNNGAYGLVRNATGTPIDSPVSGNLDDPYTDWIYWYDPVDTSPGQAGYQAYASAGGDGAFADNEALARTSLVSWNGLSRANTFPLPEQGTVFRIETTKPNAAGDTFTFDTSQIGVTTGDLATREAALDLIAVTPNPYRGFSGYESGSTSSVVRFVNLPAQATVRVFTLNGTLVRTLEKASAATGTTLDWDLDTEAGLPVASGIYLIHVEARDTNGAVIGERILKFAAVRRRVQLEGF